MTKIKCYLKANLHLYLLSSSLKKSRMFALSRSTTALSSAAVLAARTWRIKSRKRIEAPKDL